MHSKCLNDSVAAQGGSGGSGTLVLAAVRGCARGVAAVRLGVSCTCRSPQARPIGAWCSWCGLRLSVSHVGGALAVVAVQWCAAGRAVPLPGAWVSHACGARPTHAWVLPCVCSASRGRCSAREPQYKTRRTAKQQQLLPTPLERRLNIHWQGCTREKPAGGRSGCSHPAAWLQVSCRRAPG